MKILLYFATVLLVSHNHVFAIESNAIFDMLELTGLIEEPVISGLKDVIQPLVDWGSEDDHHFIDMARKNKRRHVESYEVTTEDGYMLTLFNIPAKKSNPMPILLLHSILDSCNAFLMRDNNSLAMTLANTGHDVWYGNFRGNRYSRKHKTIDPDNENFWDFCLDDIGKFDMPAMIDLVLKESNHKQLIIIGHGTGAGVAMINGCVNPEYNKKVKLLIALAPAPFIYSVPEMQKLVFLLPPPMLTAGANVIHEHEKYGYDSLKIRLVRTFCNIPKINYEICVKTVLFSIIGPNPKGFEEEFTSTFFNNFPAGSSMRCFTQFYQTGYSQAFTMFDYGTASNQVIYGSPVPTEYPLNNVTMNVAIYAGINDRLTKVSDAEVLRNKLPNVVDFQVIGKEAFNHYDFVIGKTMTEELFPIILKQLEKAGSFEGSVVGKLETIASLPENTLNNINTLI